jgi:hypothetical protein
MLDTLITSRTRIKLLLKFFLNTNSETYLRNLEQEFGESSNGIRIELNRLEEAGLLKSSSKGNKKYFKANTNHPLFPDIHNIILKHIGLDKIIDDVIIKIGKLHCVYILGDFAIGKDSSTIDLAFIGPEINTEYLNRLINKVEKLIQRNIKYLIFNELEINKFLHGKSNSEYLLLWEE